MVNRYLFCLSLFSCISLSAWGDTPLPGEVQHFIDNAEMCQHFAGEWDPTLPEENKKDIEKGLNEYCPQAEKSLPLLKKKYSDNNDILRLLSSYNI